MEGKTLEEISWKDGFFIDRNGNIVNPEPIGMGEKCDLKNNYEISKEETNQILINTLRYKGNQKYEEVNAYSLADIGNSQEQIINFYKI